MEDQKKVPFEAKLLNEVAQKIELDSIQCVALDSRVVRFDEPTEILSLEFTFNSSWRRVDSRPGLEVVFNLSVALVEQKGPSENSAIFTFSGVWHLQYTLPEIAPVDWDDRFTMFASTNAVVNVWPYARAEVQERLIRAGLPPLLLPVFRAGKGTTGRADFARAPQR